MITALLITILIFWNLWLTFRTTTITFDMTTTSKIIPTKESNEDQR